jgi:hypothetical protein
MIGATFIHTPTEPARTVLSVARLHARKRKVDLTMNILELPSELAQLF